MVVGIHADLVVVGESIHETEEFMADGDIHYEVDPWQRETIFWACSVDANEVDAELMSLKVIYFQSIFLIDFYIKRLIYMQEYGITLPNLLCSRKLKKKHKLQ